MEAAVELKDLSALPGNRLEALKGDRRVSTASPSIIVNRGRQVARGDLNALKLLSQGVYEVSITFDAMPAQIETALRALPTLHSRLDNNTLEVAFKAPEGQVLDIVSAVARNRRVLRLEVNGASLEDVFLELTQKQEVQ